MPRRDEDERERMWRLAGRYSAIGIEIAVAITLPTLVGIWADRKLGSGPWLLLAGLAVGVGAAVRVLMKIVRDVKREKL